VIRLSAEALDEIDEAVVWYDKRRDGLGADLLSEVDRALEQVDARPQSFARLRDLPEDLTVRRALLDRFPFALVFLEVQEGSIRVVAFAHTKRQPGYWLSRVFA
jgi:toxin ParE1/3/4